MLTTVMATTLLAAAPSYQVQGSPAPRTVHEGRAAQSCFALAPELTLTVDGPAKLKLKLRVDLPAKPKRPKPVALKVAVDGKGKSHRLKPRRAKASYADASGAGAPSAALKPVPVAVGKGEHTLTLALPAGHSGCVEVLGAELVQSAPALAQLEASEARSSAAASEPAAAAPIEPELPAAEPPDEALASAAPTDAAALSPEAVPPASDEQAPPAEAGSPLAVEEIRASEIGAAAPQESASAAPRELSARAGDLVRVGPSVGGLLPRGDLKPTFALGLHAEMPLAAVGLASDFMLGGLGADVSAYFEGGWSPMRQQDQVMVPGRGQADLIQNTLVLPFELGARLRLDVGMPVVPYAGIGLAMDVTRTELQMFSLPPVHENDVAFGVAVAAGGRLALGPGELWAEVRYREVRADLGQFGDIAEPTLASTALHIGYAYSFAR